MATLHGLGGIVYMASTPSGAATPLGEARSWTIHIDQDLVEKTEGFGQVWKTYLLASTGWKAQIDGNFDTANTTPFDAANQPAQATYGAVRVYIYPARSSPSRFYSGTAWPKLTVQANHTSTIRFSLDLTGDGALSAA
jgi:hypothetical protein